MSNEHRADENHHVIARLFSLLEKELAPENRESRLAQPYHKYSKPLKHHTLAPLILATTSHSVAFAQQLFKKRK